MFSIKKLAAIIWLSGIEFAFSVNGTIRWNCLLRTCFIESFGITDGLAMQMESVFLK